MTQWTVVWAFLKPSRENVRSAKSAAKDEEGRQRKDGAGVKCTLSLEDQLLVSLMRLSASWKDRARACLHIWD